MGYRTVVMLNNDFSWYQDTDLHRKILHDMNKTGNDIQTALGQMGKVVECTHADTVTLARLGFYTNFDVITYGYWSEEDTDLELIKKAAKEKGYRLVKT